MFDRWPKGLCTLCLTTLLAVWPVAVLADSASDVRTADGVKVYLGILPTEMITGHPKEHPEATMHGGPSAHPGQYHIVVALFDTATGERISDAEVSARVIPLGMGGEEKALRAMPLGQAPSYGNYFSMPGNGPFRIVVRVRRPGSAGPVEVTFEHRHD